MQDNNNNKRVIKQQEDDNISNSNAFGQNQSPQTINNEPRQEDWPNNHANIIPDDILSPTWHDLYLLYEHINANNTEEVDNSCIPEQNLPQHQVFQSYQPSHVNFVPPIFKYDRPALQSDNGNLLMGYQPLNKNTYQQPNSLDYETSNSNPAPSAEHHALSQELIDFLEKNVFKDNRSDNKNIKNTDSDQNCQVDDIQPLNSTDVNSNNEPNICARRNSTPIPEENIVEIATENQYIPTTYNCYLSPINEFDIYENDNINEKKCERQKITTKNKKDAAEPKKRRQKRTQGKQIKKQATTTRGKNKNDKKSKSKKIQNSEESNLSFLKKHSPDFFEFKVYFGDNKDGSPPRKPSPIPQDKLPRLKYPARYYLENAREITSWDPVTLSHSTQFRPYCTLLPKNQSFPAIINSENEPILDRNMDNLIPSPNYTINNNDFNIKNENIHKNQFHRRENRNMTTKSVILDPSQAFFPTSFKNVFQPVCPDPNKFYNPIDEEKLPKQENYDPNQPYNFLNKNRLVAYDMNQPYNLPYKNNFSNSVIKDPNQACNPGNKNSTTEPVLDPNHVNNPANQNNITKPVNPDSNEVYNSVNQNHIVQPVMPDSNQVYPPINQNQIMQPVVSDPNQVYYQANQTNISYPVISDPNQVYHPVNQNHIIQPVASNSNQIYYQVNQNNLTNPVVSDPNQVYHPINPNNIMQPVVSNPNQVYYQVNPNNIIQPVVSDPNQVYYQVNQNNIMQTVVSNPNQVYYQVNPNNIMQPVVSDPNQVYYQVNQNNIPNPAVSDPNKIYLPVNQKKIKKNDLTDPNEQYFSPNPNKYSENPKK